MVLRRKKLPSFGCFSVAYASISCSLIWRWRLERFTSEANHNKDFINPNAGATPAISLASGHLWSFLFLVHTTVLTSLSQFSWLLPRQKPDEAKIHEMVLRGDWDSALLWSGGSCLSKNTLQPLSSPPSSFFSFSL